MKKTLSFFAVLFLAAGLFAQSLENNEYYRKSVELANLSQEAMEASDYDAAAEYAIESQKYAALSRQYIDEALAALQSRAAQQSRPEVQPRKDIQTHSDLAAEYEVKLNSAKRDCLWRIAGFDFIYKDPAEWKRIYEYNKDTFRFPDNPDFIYPGQVLRIPPVDGEARSGRR
jgi:nucleoid-associated protein YgaU